MCYNTLIKVQVSYWGESPTMYALLVDLTFDANGKRTGASRKVWFPKSICKLDRVQTEGIPEYYLTCPAWLLDKNNVDYEQKNVRFYFERKSDWLGNR